MVGSLSLAISSPFYCLLRLSIDCRKCISLSLLPTTTLHFKLKWKWQQIADVALASNPLFCIAFRSPFRDCCALAASVLPMNAVKEKESNYFAVGIALAEAPSKGFLIGQREFSAMGATGPLIRLPSDGRQTVRGQLVRRNEE